jgi:ADP-ribose pyrophosphatase YjhB (NUDIX family)
MKKTLSAGGVVVNPRGEVLVVNQRGNSWSLPKGHVEEGEAPLAAARREVREESGVSRLELLKDLGSYGRPRIAKGGRGDDVTEWKTLHFFLFRTTQTDLDPEDPVHPEARWVAPERVPDLLTHPRDREFFLAVLPELARLPAAE